MFRYPLGVGLRDGERVPIVGQEDILLASRAWLDHRLRVLLPPVSHPERAGADEETQETAYANWARRPHFAEERLAAFRFEASLGWRPWLSRGMPWRRRSRRRRLAKQLRREA
jgi:hypothetical protein